MVIFIKSLFYAFLITILFLVSLYHIPEFSEFIDEKTGTQISADIKLKVDHVLEKTGIIDSVIDSFWTNTKGNIDSRVETFENLSQ